MSRYSRSCWAVVVLLAATSDRSAAQTGPAADAKKLVTRTYDLKPVLGSKSAPRDLADMDAVVRMIFETIPVGEIKPGVEGPRFTERDGGVLEVRATEKVHGEVKDLIDALGRLTDLAIDIRTDVYEFDRATFDKSVKPLFPPLKGRTEPSAVLGTGDDDAAEVKGRAKAEAAAKALKLARLVQSSSRRYANGPEAVVAARQAVVPYSNFAGEAIGAVPGKVLYVKDGFRLLAEPVVSADRRFVRFKLTEQSSAVVGERRRDLGEIGGKPVVAVTPRVEDFGKAGTVEVGDGGSVLFRLDYAPKDKLWVVVLRPRIFIREEQEELERQAKERLKKK